VPQDVIIPPRLVQHTRQLRDGCRTLSDALSVHARDLMAEGSTVDALAGTQLVRAHIDAAAQQLESALREAGADG
jgi:hypothetical protein